MTTDPNFWKEAALRFADILAASAEDIAHRHVSKCEHMRQSSIMLEVEEALRTQQAPNSMRNHLSMRDREVILDRVQKALKLYAKS